MTMASCVSTGPATPAGNLVVGNAEVIAALALIQMLIPVRLSFTLPPRPPWTCAPAPTPAVVPRIFFSALPPTSWRIFTTCPSPWDPSPPAPSCPTGRRPWITLSPFMASASGTDMLLGCGLLHGSRILSYEQMVMDCEIQYRSADAAGHPAFR